MRDDLQDPYYRPRESNAFATLALFAMGMAIGMILIVVLRACDAEPVSAMPTPDCQSCHTATAHSKMTAYFKRNGSKTPEQMATAVLMTENPRLLAAIAVKENTPHTVRHGGYKGQHAGSWQVNPRHWGKVPRDAVGQALQAERIITELTTDYGIKKALSIYGGDSTTKYQRTILAELQGVPR